MVILNKCISERKEIKDYKERENESKKETSSFLVIISESFYLVFQRVNAICFTSRILYHFIMSVYLNINLTT